MRRRSPPPTLILASVVLLTITAGCMSGEPPASTDDPDDTRVDDGRVDPDAVGRYHAWERSEFWTWDMQIRGFERFDGVKLVYYDKVGPEYLIGTPSRDEALYHAVFSVNPILGRVHEGLLSPHENGVHAAMFPFDGPNDVLRDGETWSTTFYETLLGFEAQLDEAIPTPDGPMPGFRIVGTNPEGGLKVEHNFVAQYKWFTHMRVTDDEGVRFELTLIDHGTGYTGPAHFIRAKDFFHETITSGDNLFSETRTFTVKPEHVDDDRVEGFAISTDIESNIGDATVRILDPDGETIYERRYSDGETASGEFNIETVYAQGSPSSKPIGERPQFPAGTYDIVFEFTNEASAEVHVVGIQDNSGRV